MVWLVPSPIHLKWMDLYQLQSQKIEIWFHGRIQFPKNENWNPNYSFNFHLHRKWTEPKVHWPSTHLRHHMVIQNRCKTLTIEFNINGSVSRIDVPIESGLACIFPCIGCRDLGYLHNAGPGLISNPHLGEGDPRWKGPLPLEGTLIGHSTGEVGNWHYIVWPWWYRQLRGMRL